MDVKRICSALALGATIMTGSMQAFGADLAHTPGTPQNAARLKADAQIANASRIARARERGQQVANARESQEAVKQRNDQRLAEDARIANASRIARGRERGADVANYRRSHTPGTPDYTKRIGADEENYRVSHTAGTAQNTARLNEDAKIAEASRARRAAYAKAHPNTH